MQLNVVEVLLSPTNKDALFLIDWIQAQPEIEGLLEIHRVEGPGTRGWLKLKLKSIHRMYLAGNVTLWYAH